MRTMTLSLLMSLFGTAAFAETKEAPPPPSPNSASTAAPVVAGDKIAEIATEAGLSKALVEKLSPEQLTQIVRSHHAVQHDDVPAVAIVVPVVLFLVVLLIVVVGLYVAFRKDAHRHETIRKLIEKEAPIPPELLTPQTRRSDLRRGLIFMGSGLGLAIALVVMPNTEKAWALGAIPLFIGMGYLIAWRIEGRSSASSP
jgi:hypothetical protein